MTPDEILTSIMGRYRMHDSVIEARLPGPRAEIGVTAPVPVVIEVRWPPVRVAQSPRQRAEPVVLAAPRTVVPRYLHRQVVTWIPARRAGR